MHELSFNLENIRVFVALFLDVLLIPVNDVTYT